MLPLAADHIVGSEQQEYSRKGAKTPRITENEIGKIVVDSAIAVHRALGPGLLETVYEVLVGKKPKDLIYVVDEEDT